MGMNGLDNMKYGLLGKSLKHSLSKFMHHLFKNDDYILKEINEEELDNFFKSKDFLGINVTIPYKEKVIRYLNFIDPLAKEIGCVNVIINDNGFLKGYNTDYYGFEMLLKSNKIDVSNKNVLILGSGGTSKMVQVYLKHHNCKSVYIASRTKKDYTYTYEEIKSLRNIDYIINTTPKEMYPNNDEEIISLDTFSSLKGVIDVIYNPLKTNLLLKAEKKNILAINGLTMLLEQGKYTHYLFFKEKVNIDKSNLEKRCLNIILIGMSCVGKTSIAKILATKLNKKYIDLDEEIEKNENRSINEIFEVNGEAYFRNIECNICKKYAKEQNLIIATGGGIVLNEQNIWALRQNGIIIYVDRDEDKIIIDDKRPLLKSRNDYKMLSSKRKSLYNKYADFKVDNNLDIKTCVNKIIYLLEEKS